MSDGALTSEPATMFITVLRAAAIPTLWGWAMVLMAVLLATAAGWRLRQG